MQPLAIAGAALLALLVSAEELPKYEPDPRDFGPGTIDVSAYPKDQQLKYELYAEKCKKCHPLARSVNARFNAQEWKRYMKRMVRRPNSGVNEEQAADIYDFLKFHSVKLGL